MLKEHVRKSYEASRRSNGYRRVGADLRAQGYKVGEERVARLMREERLQGRQKRGYKPSTTQSNHDWPIAPNRLKGQPTPSACDQVWRTDITYIPTDEGWLYLAVVIDACSRRIIGWSFSRSLGAGLAVKALLMAVALRGGKLPHEVILAL